MADKEKVSKIILSEAPGTKFSLCACYATKQLLKIVTILINTSTLNHGRIRTRSLCKQGEHHYTMSPDRVTGLGEFSNGRSFILSNFIKITEVAQNFGLLFPVHCQCFNFMGNSVGLHFGRFFYKLIWSPWLQTYVTTHAYKLQE
jgi:hypothetical protein